MSDETVRVPAALVEDLRRAMRYVDVKDSLLAREDQEDAFKCARALVDAAERPDEGEVPKRVCGDVSYGWSGEEIIEADAPRRPCVSEHGDAAKCRKCYPAPAAPVGEPRKPWVAPRGGGYSAPNTQNHPPSPGQSLSGEPVPPKGPGAVSTTPPAPLSSPRRTRDEAAWEERIEADRQKHPGAWRPDPHNWWREGWLAGFRAARLAGEDDR